MRNQPRKIVEKVASDIENLLAKKRKALDVSMMRLIEPAKRREKKVFYLLQVKPSYVRL